MTMPLERTRALRWGWEFLMELQSSHSLTAEQRMEVEALLLVVPCARDLREWTAPGAFNPMSFELEREEEAVSRAEVPESIDRPFLSMDQYADSVVRAGAFFKSLNGANNLDESLRRQVPYVLRHWPLWWAY
jgi:hypothetical protein